MPLEIPRIDDRNYQQILNETLSRIPVHNPEWTNFNDSDPGVTILQLFAFMTENLLYRANLIPERNRRKFLKLLGIPIQAAAAAQGLVALKNERGPLATITLPRDLEVLAGQIPYRTQDGLDVLPVESLVFYKRKLAPSRRKAVEEIYSQLYRSHEEDGDLEFYETIPLTPPTDNAAIPAIDLGSREIVDGSLWIALLSRPNEDKDQTRQAIANKSINIGIMPDLRQASKRLLPAGAARIDGSPPLVFEIATNEFQTTNGLPRYDRLKTSTDTVVLNRPGVVEATLPAAAKLMTWDFTEPLEMGTDDFPPSLEDTQILDRIITWIRVRLPQQGSGSGLRARISWIGINATRIRQRAQVPFENLGIGTGEPDQQVTLINTPVIAESVSLTVGGNSWRLVDDLLNAAPEVPQAGMPSASAALPNGVQEARVFTVDREAGLIRFGDGARGARPPVGAPILASYDYGGGKSGNVNIGEINRASALPAGIQVTNPLPTYGGDEPESIAEAERNIPKFLRHKDRGVSALDFKDIVARTPGVDVGRVEVIPLFHPKQPQVCYPGVVTIMVVPAEDNVQPEAPLPDRLFLDLVCRHLEPRRLLTTEIHVSGPDYKPLYVAIGIEIVAGFDFPPVREAVNDAIRRFLSPLEGGREGMGWPLEKAVIAQELWAEASRVDAVAFVTGVRLGDAAGAPLEQMSMSGLQLPRLLKVDTQQGEAERLDLLLGVGTVSPETAAKRRRIVPIPVVPEEC